MDAIKRENGGFAVGVWWRRGQPVGATRGATGIQEDFGTATGPLARAEAIVCDGWPAARDNPAVCYRVLHAAVTVSLAPGFRAAMAAKTRSVA